MRTTWRLPFALGVLALVAAGCRREAAAPDPAAAVDTDRAERRAALYGPSAAENLRVVPVEIDVVDLPHGWNGLRIAAVSDLQLGLWPDNVEVARAAMATAAAQNPDFIVLLGDYVARGEDYDALDRVLEPLRGRTVFAVLGDRDEQDDARGQDTVRELTVQALERNDVRVLRNARAAFERNGDTAYVAGLEPYIARRPNWRRAEIFNGIAGGPATPVLFAHMPVTAVILPVDRYPSLIAGHTFCGPIEVPGTPRLSWVNTEIFPGSEPVHERRMYRIRGSTVFITCGVGYTFVPARYAAAPEVALITLRRPGEVDIEAPMEEEADAEIEALLEGLRGEAEAEAEEP